MLKRAGNVNPIAASSFTSFVRCSNSTKTTVSTPVPAAARIRSGDDRLSVRKKASTIPGRIAWLIASLIKVIRRRTKNTPGKAHATAVTIAMSWISRWSCITFSYSLPRCGCFNNRSVATFRPCLFRWCRSQSHKSPRFGAKAIESPTTTVAHSTIVGPVGMREALLLIIVPLTPASAPKHAARNIIRLSLFVHCRAATAGATNIALIRTAPTACKPRTIAITRRLVNRISSTRIGNPKRCSETFIENQQLQLFPKDEHDDDCDTTEYTYRQDIALQDRSGLSEEKRI